MTCSGKRDLSEFFLSVEILVDFFFTFWPLLEDEYLCPKVPFPGAGHNCLAVDMGDMRCKSLRDICLT